MNKKTYCLFINFLFLCLTVLGTTALAQEPNVLCKLRWDEFPITKRNYSSYTVSIGAYCFIDDETLALLQPENQNILIYSIEQNALLKTIDLNFIPIDFVFHDGLFHVLGAATIQVFDIEGRNIRRWKFKRPETTFFSITDFQLINECYLLSIGDGTTWELTENNLLLVDSSNHYFSNLFKGNVTIDRQDSFSFSLFHRDNQLTTQTISLSEIGQGSSSLSMVKMLSADSLQVVFQIHTLDVTTIQNSVVFFDYQNRVVTHQIMLPESEYVFIQNPFEYNRKTIYYAHGTPDGISFYILDSKTSSVLHRNNTKNDFSPSEIIFLEAQQEAISVFAEFLPIERNQIIENAYKYLDHEWIARQENIWNGINCGEKTIQTPEWIVPETQTDFPYCWGGNSTPSDFDLYLLQNKSAGDRNTETGYGAEPSCAVGVDCSGFISRTFGLSQHYATSMLPNITTLYSSWNSLKRGDILLKPGHVMLFESFAPTGEINVIESVGTYWRVKQSTYSILFLESQNYKPRFYNNLIDCNQPPTPTITRFMKALQSDALSGNQWYNESGKIHDATKKDFIVTETGTYYTIVTLQGCSSEPSNQIYVKINENEPDSSLIVKIFPNPATDELTIEIEENTETIYLSFTNILGQTLFESHFIERTMLDICFLNAGLYFVSLRNNSIDYTCKIIKK